MIQINCHQKMALTIQSPPKSIIKAVWSFLPPPPVSHIPKHHLRSSKTQITVDASIVFYSVFWPWKLLGYRDYSQHLHSQSRMIAGQTISCSMAGLKERRNLPPSLSPISVSSLQSDAGRELFQPVQHLIALSSAISNISLRLHPDELKDLQKLLKLCFPRGILEALGGKRKPLLNTKMEGKKNFFSAAQSKCALFFQPFLHFGGCPSFKPVRLKPSRLFCSADPSHNPEPWNYFFRLCLKNQVHSHPSNSSYKFSSFLAGILQISSRCCSFIISQLSLQLSSC